MEELWQEIGTQDIVIVAGLTYQLDLGIFERIYNSSGNKWRIKCVKCASGRTVKSTDREVLRARNMKD